MARSLEVGAALDAGLRAMWKIVTRERERARARAREMHKNKHEQTPFASEIPNRSYSVNLICRTYKMHDCMLIFAICYFL